MITKIYKSFRDSLPARHKSKLSRLVFAMPWKPYVKKDKIDPKKKFPGGEKGGMIISADFEMSWAFRYSKRTKDFKQMGKQERENFPVILDILDKYKIPITWATVGHLFLKGCQKGDHDWMAPMPHFDDHWKFTEGAWFDHDPCSDVNQDPEWYAPDLIEQIIASDVNHEIGCHTFSHIDCTYKNCPPEVMDDELKACTEAAKPYGISLSSFVFPGGTHGNYEMLHKNGYHIYRKNMEVELAYPFKDKFGMFITPTSSAFGDNGLGWSKEYYIYRFKKYINRAIKTNTVAHFWFHPSMDKFTLENVFPEIIKFAGEKRKQGDLWIGTMKEIVDHMNNSDF